MEELSECCVALPRFAPQGKKSSLKEAMLQLANNTQFVNESKMKFQNQAASIRNLEEQVGQLARMLNNRQQVNLPSTTEVNSKEQCKVITFRNGKIVALPIRVEKTIRDDQENSIEEPTEQENMIEEISCSQ